MKWSSWFWGGLLGVLLFLLLLWILGVVLPDGVEARVLRGVTAGGDP